MVNRAEQRCTLGSLGPYRAASDLCRDARDGSLTSHSPCRGIPRQWIRAVTPPDTVDPEGPFHETDPGTMKNASDDRAASHAPEARLAAAAQTTDFAPLAADQTPDPDPPAPTGRIADRERASAPKATELTDHASLHPRNDDGEPDRRAYAAAADPASNEEPLEPPRWGYQRRLRTDGKPTVWQRRWEPLAAEQSASRFPGKKPRGSPRG